MPTDTTGYTHRLEASDATTQRLTPLVLDQLIDIGRHHDVEACV